MKALKQEDPSAEFRCWGGDLMQAQGGELVKHYRDLAFMGFIEVVANLRTILKNIDHCKKDLLDYQPDALILIDYPGFNLRIAEFAKKQGLKVLYYISPQVWAWKKGRVHKIKRDVDRMFVILPFEQKFYQDYDYTVDFVGHPLLDAIAQRAEPTPLSAAKGKPIVALLPGSRKQEITTMLPVMLDVAAQHPGYQFVVAGAPSQAPEFYQEIIGNKNVALIIDDTYNLLQQATAALVTSGTATLEAGLFGVPQVVCYKGSAISFAIAKRLVNVEYISLVNLIMEKEVVKELIQADFTVEKVSEELTKILPNGEKRRAMLTNYSDLHERLGGEGASANTAKGVLKTLAG